MNRLAPGCNRSDGRRRADRRDRGRGRLRAAGAVLSACTVAGGPVASVLPAADVEDVLQETFLAVWRGAGVPAEGAAGGWLWGSRAVRPRCSCAAGARPRWRCLRCWPTGGRRAIPPRPRCPGCHRARSADLGPEGSPEREVWRLIYVEDRPVAEAAELMGVPVGTVKSRAHRARRRLRAALRGGRWREGTMTA